MEIRYDPIEQEEPTEEKVAQLVQLRKQRRRLSDQLMQEKQPERRQRLLHFKDAAETAIEDLEDEAKESGWWGRVRPLDLTKQKGGAMQALTHRASTSTAAKLSDLIGENTRTTPARPYSKAPKVTATEPYKTSMPISGGGESLSGITREFASQDWESIRKPTMKPGIGNDIVQVLWLGVAATLQIGGSLLMQRMRMGHVPWDKGSKPARRPIDMLEDIHRD